MTTTPAAAITLADLLECFSGRRFTPLAAQRVQGFALDSRECAPGGVFVALPGERVDGHTYVAQAFTRGAAIALVDAARTAQLKAAGVTVAGPHDPPPALPFALALEGGAEAGLQKLAAWWRARQTARVIGVTGSIGKTTTKELIAQVLELRHTVLKSEGNRNNALGVPLTLLRIDAAHEYAVVEMGMDRPGEIALYCDWARPQIGVITNVGPSHMEKLGSIEAITRAKAELVQALPPAVEGGVAILNADDARVRAMAALTQARVLTYGLDPDAQVRASEVVSEGMSGVTFRLHHYAVSQLVHLKLLGQHSVHTALRAAAVGIAAGMSLGDIGEGLSAEAAQLRLVAAHGPLESLVLDDTYNASPESTLAALNLLRDINGSSPRIAVLGDMLELGDAETEGHEQVGCRAAQVADVIICVGARSRITARSAVECGARADSVHTVMSNGAAVGLLRTLVTKRSVILVKGSLGMHMDEIVTALGEDLDGR